MSRVARSVIINGFFERTWLVRSVSVKNYYVLPILGWLVRLLALLIWIIK